MTITFEVLGRAQPRGSKRAFMRPGMRFPVITDDNPRSKPWMQEVAAVAMLEMQKQQRRGLIDGPVVLYVDFYFSRPKGHFGKRGLRASAPAHHTTKPDSTKLLRGLEDALKGIIWRDDSQVIVQMVRKSYGNMDRTVVKIEEVSDA